ncbi:unnamed protein product [Cylindrotheca closterium]|uniref:DUF6824 domain-containing protein n=1 Tax=Cylindrotheca closterium TaxID=2856 RepID=A0AAD2JP10_9STRA|nr:unnamed protein product [Cylindrotheca closterium]
MMYLNTPTESPNSSPFEFERIRKEVDSIIAQCMNDTTHEERQKSYLEVHGVTNGFDETPAAVQDALEGMKMEIQKITKNRDALTLAESMDEEYVNDPSLHLKFLRGEKFNVKKAAQKFVRHFELKLELFGKSKLVKDIEQEDLGEDDMEALHLGYVQWLPLRDISGRTVTVYFTGKTASKATLLSKLKVFFYLRMIAMEDEVFQKKGMVFISQTGLESEVMEDVDQPAEEFGVKETARLCEALPECTQSVHVCIPNVSSIGAIVAFGVYRFAMAAYNKLVAIRTRIHIGSSQEECFSKLQAFGIPVAVIPKSPADNDYHINLMQRRKRLEHKRRQRKRRQGDGGIRFSSQNDQESEQVEDSDDEGFTVSFDPLDERCNWICAGPAPSDVILGRGRKANNHPGNIRLRTMVDDLIGVYKNTSKREKTEIAQRVVVSIQTNGRFLKENEMIGWVEVPDKVARIKVSHAFRDSYRVKRKQGGDNGQSMVGQKHQLEMPAGKPTRGS